MTKRDVSNRDAKPAWRAGMPTVGPLPEWDRKRSQEVAEQAARELGRPLSDFTDPGLLDHRNRS